MHNKSKKTLSVIIVVLIVITIGGIWIIKNRDRLGDNNISSNQEFQLEETSIDLEKIKEYNMPIVIDFGADSCVPCKEMAPVLKKLNEEWQNKAIVKFVDVWKNGDAAKEFPIQVIPTQVFYAADGKPYVPSESVQQRIEFTMYSTRETEEHIFTVHQGGLTEEEMRLIFSDMGVE